MTFEYANLSGRPPGRVLSLAGRLFRGVRDVQAQIVPFAQAWQDANRRSWQQTGPLWVVLGDSMSQGIGAAGYRQGWVGQLADRLAREGQAYRVLNLAVSGARVRDVLERQLPAMAALGVEPDLVSVMIGSNDLVSPAYRRQLPGDYAELLGRLPAGAVVSSLPNPTEAARAVNALLATAAAQHRIYVAEMGEATLRSWRGKLAADWFHPNELGYAQLADAFAEAIARRSRTR